MANMVMSLDKQYKINEKNIPSGTWGSQDDIENFPIHRDCGRDSESSQQLTRGEQARSSGASDQGLVRPPSQPGATGKVLNELIALSKTRSKRLEQQLAEEVQYTNQLQEILLRLEQLAQDPEN